MLPNHEFMRDSSNIRNGIKVRELQSMLFLEDAVRATSSSNLMLAGYPKGNIARVARYERIQFSTNLSPRRFECAGDFHLKVELSATLMDDLQVPVLSTITPPLVVRGRSPSNYQPCSHAERNRKAMLKGFYAGMASVQAVQIPDPPPATVLPPISNIFCPSSSSSTILEIVDSTHEIDNADESEQRTPFLKSFKENFHQHIPRPAFSTEFIDTALLQQLAVTADHQLPRRQVFLTTSPSKYVSCIQQKEVEDISENGDTLGFVSELNFVPAYVEDAPLGYTTPTSSRGHFY